MKRFNEEKFEGKVYVHVNRLNGKAYVGATTKKPEYRWGKNGSGYRKGKFKEAIEEYGWSAFDHIIYDDVFTSPEELNSAEKELVEAYDSIKNGYNVAKAGTVNYGLLSESVSKNSASKRAVIMLNKDLTESKYFESLHEAGRWLHENVAQHISPDRLSKKVGDIVTPGVPRKTAYGYTFIDVRNPDFTEVVKNVYAQ